VCTDCHGFTGSHAIHNSATTGIHTIVTPTSTQTTDTACVQSGCHGDGTKANDVLAIHAAGCLCHKYDAATIAIIDARPDKSFVCTDCHGEWLTSHAQIGTLHAIPQSRQDCLASGCHDANSTLPFAGKSVEEIHSSASTTTAGVTRASCEICHATGIAPTTDCLTAGCHAGHTAYNHGYVPSTHSANATAASRSLAPRSTT